jgi:ABC-type transport system involved in cytochrome c biogenesis ATPase subunit
MLQTLHIKNFTLFSDVQLKFSPGLNVIIGDNGTGKSHLLYLGYAVESVWHEARQDYLYSTKNKDKESWQRDIAQKLKTVFRPEKLGRLCRLQQRQRAEITLIPSLFELPQPQLTTAFSFFVTATEKVKIEQIPSFGSLKFSKKQLESFKQTPLPLFFPIKEVLSFYPGFMKSYEERELAFSAIDYDLCKALTGAPLRGKRALDMAELIAPLEKILQGKVIVELNRFYLQHTKQGKMEISLVAEGLRKMAMLSYLLKNGGLAKGSTLFWDEPEANLNAKLRVKLVELLVALVKIGVQVILATQDLFLMKELSLRAISPKMPTRFFSLHQDVQKIEVEQGDQLDDLSHIVAIDAELDQTDRGQEIFYQEIFEPEAA